MSCHNIGTISLPYLQMLFLPVPQMLFRRRSRLPMMSREGWQVVPLTQVRDHNDNNAREGHIPHHCMTNPLGV